jgi:hypothetical protein
VRSISLAFLTVLAVALLVGCEGRSASAAWILDPAYEINAETTDLHLVAQEHGCGFPLAEERVMPPEITYGTDEIRLTIRIRMSEYGCAMLYPPFPLAVHLSEPIGSRSITHGAGGMDIRY